MTISCLRLPFLLVVMPSSSFASIRPSIKEGTKTTLINKLQSSFSGFTISILYPRYGIAVEAMRFKV
ncbi:unnamed protein product [Cuscuta campestris]|uniref:Uncharacterized protein n=1 Tax=Cuscuta campestris TaxID=132261 RepID=A0A484KK67_9ASTE|nr:unnamed protein product [Cuscuta campestris]